MLISAELCLRDDRKEIDRMKEFMRKQPILVALVCLGIGIVAIKLPVYSIPGLSVVRFVMTAILFGVITVMGGGGSLLRVREGAADTLRKSVYPLILAFLVGGLMVMAAVFGNNVNTEGLAAKEIKYLVLCASIGLFEESLFRGVLFSGLLRKMGSTQKGILGAVLLSSLIFGFIHVENYVFGGSYDLVGCVQAVLKILQSGALGFLLAALYMKNKNIWMIALVHGLNDFFPMQAAIIGSASLGNYVGSGTEGVGLSVVYLVYFLLYIPMIVLSVRIIKKQELPEYGVFKD